MIKNATLFFSLPPEDKPWLCVFVWSRVGFPSSCSPQGPVKKSLYLLQSGLNYAWKAQILIEITYHSSGNFRRLVRQSDWQRSEERLVGDRVTVLLESIIGVRCLARIQPTTRGKHAGTHWHYKRKEWRLSIVTSLYESSVLIPVQWGLDHTIQRLVLEEGQ